MLRSMKRTELFFGAALVPIDFIALLLAGAAAYFIRLSPVVQAVRPAVFGTELPFWDFLRLVAIVALVIIAVFAFQGVYAMRSTRRSLEELTRIFSGVSIGAMLVIVYMFLSAELFQSRFILMLAYILGIIFVTMARYVVRVIQLELLRRGQGVHKTVLIGNGRYGTQLASFLKLKPDYGFKVVDELDSFDAARLAALQEQHGLDAVVQTNPKAPEAENLALLEFCETHKIDFKYIPNLFEAHAANVQYRAIGGVPVVEILRTPLDGWGRVAKRVMDIFGSLVGLILFSPVMIGAAIAIKLTSPGPVFYRQVRVGKKRKSFRIFKFRSMRTEYSVGEGYGGEKAAEFERDLKQKNNERQGPLFKMKQDPRITPVGRFIRRWRIDELPQFFNVIMGEMSLLGPRPHLPEEVKGYEKHHEVLFTIKPGMSGMAQVSGNAGLSFQEEARLDIAYIETWSLRLDVVLLLKTFVLLFFDRNAV